MKKDKDTSPPRDEIADDVPQKMNGAIRRLLRMSDTEIRKLHTRDRNRLAKERKKIEETIGRFPKTATRSDRKAVARVMQLSRSRLLPHRDLVAVIPDKMKPVRIRAIVRFTGNSADLEAMGIEVHSQAQDIFTIVGTRKQLKNLVNKPACRRMRTPRIFFPTVENASAQAEITNVHDPRPPENPNGFRGNGVLVGIIDSPLDVTHHGFRDSDPAGSHDSRVLYYWAQSTHTHGGFDMWGNPITIPQPNPPGQTPEQFTNAAPIPGTRPNFIGLNYGRIYTNDNINTTLGLGAGNTYGTGNNQICCEPTTDDEHGTHCAGIAAGSGHVTNWNTNPIHVGAAPEATIIYVRIERFQAAIGLDATFEDAILDGIDFCIQAAQFHGMPIVISVSQGSNWGPHNGSTDFDLMRDNFLNSFDNRSIVFSAGNDNDVDGYKKGNVASGNSIDNFTLSAWRRAPIWLDVWYSGPELDYRISFGGNNTGWRTAGQDYVGVVSGRNIEAERDIEQSGGLRGLRIYVDEALNGDVYTIDLRNPHASQTVNYHAWVGLQGWWAILSGSTKNERTLGDTGCGKSILTVGACDVFRPPNPVSGEQVTVYSGAGPTIDGRIKPEIVAVGGTPDDPATWVDEEDPIISTASDQNNGYVGKCGTSMATPLVAGAIALLLEEYGSPPPVGLGLDLNQDTIKALITQYANRLNLHLDPTQPGYVPTERNRYGYGRLRMIGPIDHLRPPVNVDLWIRTASDDYGEEPYPGGCFCGAPDVRVFEAGTNNETTHISWGTTYDVRVTVRNLGDTDAVNATVCLKYTLPHAAPSSWFEAEDDSNNKLVDDTVTVPAMDDVEVLFHWRPEATEIGAPAGTTHFCLLAEVDHPDDPLIYAAPTAAAGGNVWSTNIKGTNNIALRNLHIQ
jgi:subtilisin family serine protease